MASLICKFCGTDGVFTSRTRTSVISYCQNCGNDWREERDIPLEDWIDKKQVANQKKVAQLAKNRR